ncbi:MAG: hypothetical protein OXH57_03745 [Ekhidna sp.]|nr:hypothetical protein [Ekhidna sp.]
MDLLQTPETKSNESNHLIKAHLFSPLQPESFFRQSPGSTSTLKGVTYTAGLEVPEDIDVSFVVKRFIFCFGFNLPDFFNKRSWFKNYISR